MLFVSCLTSQQHASVCQARIFSANCTFSHIQIEGPDQTSYLTQEQHADTGPTSSSSDPITPGVWQDSRYSTNLQVTGMTRPGGGKPTGKALGGRCLTTRPTREAVK